MWNIPCKGGVDRITPAPALASGFLRDCFNYEVGIHTGYQRIHGFERFDGRISPSTTDLWYSPETVSGGPFTVGEKLTWALGGDSGDVGVVFKYATDEVWFAYEDGVATIPDGATVTGASSSASFTFSAANVEHVTQYATDAGDYFTELDTAADQLRTAIGKCPGYGPVLGAQYFEGALYAIRSYYGHGFDGGNLEPQEGQHILDASGNEGIVHSYQLASGTFGGGTAAGYVVVQPLTASWAVANNDQLDLVSQLYFTSGSEEPSVGHTISDATAGGTGTVLRVELVAGTWAGGDAEGYLYFTAQSGSFITANNIDNDTSTTTNVMTIDNMMFTGLDNALDATGVDNKAAIAGMWKSSVDGWTAVDLGWELDYTGGTNEPDTLQIGGSESEVEADIQTTEWATPGTVFSTGTGFSWTNLTTTRLAADDGSEATVAMTGGDSNSTLVNASNFGFELDDNATIKGIEVEITARRSVGSETAAIQQRRIQIRASGMAATKWSSYFNEYPSTKSVTGVEASHTYGGSMDLWGGWNDGTDPSPADIMDSDFGFTFMLDKIATSGGQTFAVDMVRMRVHFLPPGTTYYLWDGANDLGEILLIGDHVSSGAYADNDAAGTYSIGRLDRYDFTAGTQIRTATGGAGNLIATAASAPRRNTLAGIVPIEAEASRYQIVEHNFYSSDELNAFYGVSGADYAFVYDGTYFRQIRTGLRAELDKPRHVAGFQFRLILGYGWGELNVSVAGDPTDFSGSLNAAALGYGHPITGLLRLSGQALGVFTSDSIHAMTVSGSDFASQVISPSTGAIEYTVKDAGNSPMYVDNRGVAMLATTEKYGDFEHGKLSALVQPWIIERIQRHVTDTTRFKAVVCATVARAKNQYRIYFQDGYRMTVTLFGAERVPMITFQKLYFNDDPTNIAQIHNVADAVDELGRDRQWIMVEMEPTGEVWTPTDEFDYVYEDDRGMSFDGSAFDWWFELAPDANGQPFRERQFDDFHIYGLAYGYADLNVSSAVDLARPSGTDNVDAALGESTDAVSGDLIPLFKDISLRGRQGRFLSLRFDGTGANELPHIIQMITALDEKQARVKR